MGMFGKMVKDIGNFLADPANLSRGDEAAKEYEKAAKKTLEKQKKEAEAARQFLKDQAAAGQGFINTGATKADHALQNSTQNAKTALAAGYASAGKNIDSGQSRLAALMSNDLAKSYKSDPGYQARVSQGKSALGRYAEKAGLSGSNLEALMNSNKGMATQEFQNYQNRQTGLGTQLAGMDSGLADINAKYGTAGAKMDSNLGSQLAQLYTNQGTSKANIGIGASSANNAISQSIMGALNLPVQYAGGKYEGQMQGLQNGVSLGSTIFAACDENLKKNITPADDIIEEVLSVLQPYSYGYYDEKHGKGRFVGIMAQDAEKAQAGKWLVEDTPDGKFIDMRKAMGLALAAAAYERKQRLALEARIAALEAK